MVRKLLRGTLIFTLGIMVGSGIMLDILCIITIDRWVSKGIILVELLAIAGFMFWWVLFHILDKLHKSP